MRVAVCQMNAGGGDVPTNVATAVRLLDEAGAGGADLASLPELWPAYGSPAAMRGSAAPIPGPLTDAVAEVARTRSMWIVGGSVPEAADDHVFNTSCLFDRDGEIVARYRKIHLFDVDLAGPAAAPGVRRLQRRRGARHPRHRSGTDRALDLLRRPLPRALPGADDARGGDRLRPVGVHGGDRSCALGGAAASASDRGPELRRGGGAVGTLGSPGGRPPHVRQLDRGRPVGRGAGPRPRRGRRRLVRRPRHGRPPARPEDPAGTAAPTSGHRSADAPFPAGRLRAG